MFVEVGDCNAKYDNRRATRTMHSISALLPTCVSPGRVHEPFRGGTALSFSRLLIGSSKMYCGTYPILTQHKLLSTGGTELQNKGFHPASLYIYYSLLQMAAVG